MESLPDDNRIADFEFHYNDTIVFTLIKVILS